MPSISRVDDLQEQGLRFFPDGLPIELQFPCEVGSVFELGGFLVGFSLFF